MHEFTIRTKSRTEFLNIDRQVQDFVASSGIEEGVCHVFVPHTTAGITINENADPDVLADLEKTLDKMVPWNDDYAHAEGNSAAHLKASLMGAEQTLLIQNRRLALGTWQSLFLSEFDGPRTRKVWVRISP